MQDIAARAGVVPSVLYDHFASKRELHITVLELHAEQLRDRSLRRLEGASAEELVRASIANYFEFVEEDPFIWRFLHQDPPADPEIAAVCQEIADRGTAAIADLIRFGAGGRQIGQGHHGRRGGVDPRPRHAVGMPTASPPGGTRTATCRASAWSNSSSCCCGRASTGMLKQASAG